MNTSHPLSPASTDEPHGPAPSRLSAFLDGELATEELDALLQALEGEAGLKSTCQRYQLIGEVMRASVTATPVTMPHDFVAGVRARLQADARPATTPELATLRAPAANDAVFRWKLAAGFASLAAVMAVSWGLIGREPGAPGGVGAAAPQLALNNPPVSPAAAVVDVSRPVDGAVLVNTAQGPVLRDVRLEELLAEHRQYGGMSALQMPAGFLRDATYQNAPQR